MKRIHEMKLHLLSCFLLGGGVVYLNLIYCCTCTATDTITPNQFLKDGELLVSASGYFALGFFSPGTSPYRYVGIWYNKIPEQTVVWVANNNNPITSTSSGTGSGGILSIDLHSGNLVLHDNVTKISYWSTNVSIPPLSPNSSSLQLQDNGNLVLFQDERKTNIAWQAFDYPSNTFLPQMKLGIDLKSGFNHFITSWRSSSDPANGDYQMKMVLDAAPQIFVYKKEGSIKLWRTGSWDGIRLVGIPDMATNLNFQDSYVENDEQVSFSYMIHDPSIFTRFVVIESGTTNLLTWQRDQHQWLISRFSPKDQCDYYNHCGPFTRCNPYNLGQFECYCLPGYQPKVPSEWSLRDAINGCIRMEGEQLCNKGEGFVKLASLKIPDLSNARVNRSLGLKGCEEICRKNCSCTGYANANISNGGSGCITWYGDLIDIRQYSFGGQDFYIRVSAAVLAEFSTKSKTRKVVVTALIPSISGLILVLLLGLMWLMLKHRKSKRQNENMLFTNIKRSRIIGERGTGADLKIFDLKTIVAATGNFSVSNKLGEGGFGSVYKGRLSNGQEIAVKRLSATSGQGTEEFKNEVTLIAKLQHRNLVRLLGCCIQQQEKMLVYEYLPNKGLDNFIFDEAKRSVLNWRKRLEIMMGIARGMVYLHRDSRLKIIHRDIKASNVLLDAGLEPKISDFGMARIFGSDQMEASTRRVVGTYGYMSPEYAMQGHFSEKSDVFSYGVLLLEIVSGRKNSSYYSEDDGHLNLVGHVWSLWTEANAMDIVDSSLENLNSDEVNRCIHIGLLCVQEHAINRPTMLEVLSMLSNETSLPSASPGQPAFVIRKGDTAVLISSATTISEGVDDASITKIEAR